MKFALVNPVWSFEGSTYFGCKEPHLPLELLYAREELRRSGQDVLLIDAFMENVNIAEVRNRLVSFEPDWLVLPTAPSYLFWRCPQPELRVPHRWIQELSVGAKTILIGPHASATPGATLRKTNCDVVLQGEHDQTLPLLANTPWEKIPGCCWRDESGFHFGQGLGEAEMQVLPSIDFSDYPVEHHSHKHHVFQETAGLGAELEFARGCPWSCSFCNKTLFRNRFRERSVKTVLAEVDQLIKRGVAYVYFIDEIFGVGKNVRRLLEGLAERPISIGFQTRIDLWEEETLDLLGEAHCISMECGIESITEEGRKSLNKNCKFTTERISELLRYARKRVPWVQANLIRTPADDLNRIHEWQKGLRCEGVWVSEPVPMFPFPGSPLYLQTFGEPPDDMAWERAHQYYLKLFGKEGYSDIQEQKPAALEDLECMCS
jgi:B12-binding domain/radical SAM domain protein of rhizo-twelve system